MGKLAAQRHGLLCSLASCRRLAAKGHSRWSPQGSATDDGGYEISCDENWLTHRVEIERTIGSEVKTLSLSVESRGVWRSSGQELHGVRGCDDVDLALTPATNSLPIRRLNLQVGGIESVIAAWVKFPDLTVEPLSQRYTRLAKDTYRYQSNTGFSAEIVVDDLGLVTTYPGGWERIGAL
jgi:uncharacterized protein